MNEYSKRLFHIHGLTELNSKISAAEKEIEIPMNNNYKSVKFEIIFPDENEYLALLISPDGTQYPVEVAGKFGKTAIEDAPAGEWKLYVKNELEVMGNVIVEVNGYDKETKTVDQIKTAEDIKGIRLFFIDGRLVIEWERSDIGAINIQVVHTSTKEILNEDSINGEEGYFETELPEDCDKVTVYIVPAVSQKIAGAEKSYTLEVIKTIDTTIEYPEFTITNQKDYEINISTQKDYDVDILLDGKTVWADGKLTAGLHVYQIELTEGIHEIQTIVSDQYGNKKTSETTIELDTKLPIVELNDALLQRETYYGSITIEGNVKEYESFEINNEDVIVDENGNFSCEVSLQLGKNKIPVVASDKAGNVFYYTADIVRLTEKGVQLSVPFIMGLILILFIVIRFVYMKFKRVKKGSEIKHGNVKIRKSIRYNKGTLMRIMQCINYIWIPILFLCFFVIIRVPDDSMVPTISGNSILFGNKIGYLFSFPERGDIILIKENETEKDYVVKRIVAIPGDEITFISGELYLNNVRCVENYIRSGIETNPMYMNDKFIVPDNEFFVLGDNRENSFDSRFWEYPFINKDRIKAKYLFSL